jgi:hypothetical protein
LLIAALRTSSLSSTESLASFEENEKAPEVVPEEEAEGQPKLKLFASPLKHERKASSIIEARPPSPINISGPIGVAYIDRSRPDSTPNIYDVRFRDTLYKETFDSASLRDTPEFQRYQETTNIELFYDLFFVANLTTFTDVFDINDVDTLKSYAGFFCILWFLWFKSACLMSGSLRIIFLKGVGKAA